MEGWEGGEMDPRNFENRSTPMAHTVVVLTGSTVPQSCWTIL